MEPNFSNTSRKNDTDVRHWARKLTLKKLELLKVVNGESPIDQIYKEISGIISVIEG